MVPAVAVVVAMIRWGVVVLRGYGDGEEVVEAAAEEEEEEEAEKRERTELTLDNSR
jgi:hypothetical protein